MKINVADIETTGFSKDDLIVEIGIAQLCLETGNVTTIYNELVKEESFGEKHRKAWIFQNSDLKFEDVMNAKPLDKERLQYIFDLAPTTAYNKVFDMRFLLSRGFNILELDCPMLIATKVCKLIGKLGKPKWPTVEEAWKHFFPDEQYVEKHRGADDAIHEAKIVHALYKLKHFKV